MKFLQQMESLLSILIGGGQPPAILKGWIDDRVLRPGIAYEFIEEDSGEGVPNGLLKAKSALVFSTSNTESHREKMYLKILSK